MLHISCVVICSVAYPGFLNGRGRDATEWWVWGGHMPLGPSPLREGSGEGTVSPHRKIFRIFVENTIFWRIYFLNHKPMGGVLTPRNPLLGTPLNMFLQDRTANVLASVLTKPGLFRSAWTAIYRHWTLFFCAKTDLRGELMQWPYDCVSDDDNGGGECISCFQTVRHLNLWTLEDRRNKQDLIEVFKMYKGFTRMDISELFSENSNVKVLGATHWT